MRKRGGSREAQRARERRKLIHFEYVGVATIPPDVHQALLRDRPLTEAQAQAGSEAIAQAAAELRARHLAKLRERDRGRR